MMKTSVVLCIILVQLFVSASKGTLLSSICADPTRDEVLCLEGLGDPTFFYEVDAYNKVQTASHNISSPSGAMHLSAFVYANNTLYQTLVHETGTSMRLFGLPLPTDHIDALHPNAELFLGGGSSNVPTYYDELDACACCIVGRDMHFVDLTAFNVLHSVRITNSTRKLITSVVYNNKLKRATVFMTAVTNSANGTVYVLKALEYAISGGVMVELPSVFSNLDPISGPFANSVLTAGQIDYEDNKIWYLDSPNLRLVAFNPYDLSLPCKFIYLPSSTTFFTTSYNVAYDFSAHHAYVVSDIPDGFVIHDVSLEDGVIEDSHAFKSGNTAATVHLDWEVQNLYIGLNKDAEPETVSGSLESSDAPSRGEYYGEVPHGYNKKSKVVPNLAIVNVLDFDVEYVTLIPNSPY